MIKLTDLEFQKHKHNLNSDHYSQCTTVIVVSSTSSQYVVATQLFLVDLVYWVKSKKYKMLSQKKINNEKLSFYHNLSSPNQKIGKISIMENFERLRSPAARLRFARLTLVRLGLNDGVKLWVSFKLCFKTNDFYSRG